MKLQLSIFAEDLKSATEDGCHPFAVVAEAHSEPDKKPTVIGKTEVLKNTNDPDWTKLFILHDFNLGKPMHVIVTIHDGNNSNESLGSAMFDVGAVLGTKGGILGKEVKSGGIIMAHVERYSGSGTLNLKMRGINLESKQEQVDAFFELQKKRKTVSGDVVWDCIFRSRPIEDSTSPIWDDACVELSALCKGKKKEQFRVAIKDWDDGDTHTLIGYFRVNVNQLLDGVTEGADSSEEEDIKLEKAFTVKKSNGKKETGKVVIISASTSDIKAEGAVELDTEIVVEERGEEDEDIVVEATDDIEIVPDELFGGATFPDYISGGCQLRVIVAIDYTVSNGNPKKKESLHHFTKDGMNKYQTAISKICTILSNYDSDQKYPVWGFGAKKDGNLNHCFQCGEEEEADGVQGILEAYKHAFKTGIAMSKPTNITEVIEAAGKNAKSSLDTAIESGTQEYSVLVIFTNGNVHSVEETVAAFDHVMDKPLSIVVVGVGPSDFSDMAFFNERPEITDGGSDRVQFVDMKAHEEGDDSELTEETLKAIPQQLVDYFASKGIKPNPPVEADEIVIEPFNEDEEVKADIVISESGDVQVDSDAKPPEDQPEAEPTKMSMFKAKGKEQFLKQGKQMLARQTKRFGRIQTTMQRKLDKMIDSKINEAFGISTGKKNNRNQNNSKKKQNNQGRK